MTIELYIEGRFTQRWQYDDIREGYTEPGISKFNKKMQEIINILKTETYRMLEFNEYEFYAVFESGLNKMKYSDSEMAKFNKEVMISQVDKIVKRYKKAS